MAEAACFLSVLMGLRSHNINRPTCNQGNKYMEICRTILCISVCNLFREGVRSSINLNFKFHEYSRFSTAFDMATNRSRDQVNIVLHSSPMHMF